MFFSDGQFSDLSCKMSMIYQLGILARFKLTGAKFTMIFHTFVNKRRIICLNLS